MAEEAVTKKSTTEKIAATSVRDALATPDNKASRAPKHGKGAVVSPASADVMVDVQTLAVYQRGQWTSVEHPSTWLDAQIRDGKILVK